uniref:PWWP domain-containing protein n=1 Tax=Heterorhabditis bacteriophora TaxID=37862 RepID=A0A1I7XP11_HETBA
MDVESTSEAIFNPGDLIWAKMKGFPPWPAKGFNEGIHEIRVAAGLEAQSTVDPLFAVSNSRKSPSPILTQGRYTIVFTTLVSFYLNLYHRSRSRTSSTASALKHLKKAIKRRRLDSESSGGSRRNKMISGFSERFNTDFFDHFGQFNVFTKFYKLSKPLKKQLFQERPGTPEAPAPLPRPAQFCKECGCECQLYGVKWRCTSKYCLKWNGVAEPFDQPSTSTAIPITPSITLNGDTHRSGPLEMKEIPKVKIDSSEIADERQLSTIKAKKRFKARAFISISAKNQS